MVKSSPKSKKPYNKTKSGNGGIFLEQLVQILVMQAEKDVLNGLKKENKA